MDLVLITKLAAAASIFLLVLSFGLETTLEEAFAFLHEPLPSAKAMLAMYVAVPAVSLALALWLPLHPATAFALLALAVSPVPPIFPGRGSKAGGEDRYVMSLLILASAFCFIAAPLVLQVNAWVLGYGMEFDAKRAFLTTAVTVAVPLGAGLAGRMLAPSLAKRASPMLSKVGRLLFAAMLVAALILTVPNMLTIIGDFTVLACGILAASALLIGHLFGGPNRGNQAALAVATSLRHPGIVMGMAASATEAQSRQITAATLLYLIVATLLGLAYGKWFRARMQKA